MKAAAAQPETRTIPAGEFKAKCLQLMDEVNTHKLTLIITKRGKPVGQLTAPPAAEAKPFRSIVGRTPDIQIPTYDEWMKLKEGWAKDWTDPGEKLARVARSKKSRKA